jgi:hypothetical protein
MSYTTLSVGQTNVRGTLIWKGEKVDCGLIQAHGDFDPSSRSLSELESGRIVCGGVAAIAEGAEVLFDVQQADKAALAANVRLYTPN